eukprot:4286979-Pyramimonas_sp.AAC.1
MYVSTARVHASAFIAIAARREMALDGKVGGAPNSAADLQQIHAIALSVAKWWDGVKDVSARLRNLRIRNNRKGGRF